MKKYLILIFLLLSGCSSTFQSPFQIEEEPKVLTLKAEKIETISVTTHYDGLPHIENKMTVSPEEAIIQWQQSNLKTLQNSQNQLRIIVHQAEMIKQDKPNPAWFQFDEENYTLSYHIDLQLKQGTKTIKIVPVKGKGFIDIIKKASLAKKEKGWNWLIQKMINHIETKLTTEFNEVIQN